MRDRNNIDELVNALMRERVGEYRVEFTKLCYRMGYDVTYASFAKLKYELEQLPQPSIRYLKIIMQKEKERISGEENIGQSLAGKGEKL